MEKRIFKGRIFELLLIVCKICNLEGIRIIIESDIGVVKEIDLINKCDLVIERGVKVLRNVLKEVIDMMLLMESICYWSVDIGFFILFFMVGIFCC